LTSESKINTLFRGEGFRDPNAIQEEGKAGTTGVRVKAGFKLGINEKNGRGTVYGH